MNRYLLRLCLGTGLLSFTVILGCSHRQVAHQEGCATCGQAVMVPTPVTTTTPVQYVPVQEEPARAMPTGPTTSVEPEEKVTRVQWTGSHVHDRRSFTDITANPAFAHDKNHRWLVGILDRTAESGWSLRYASMEEEDAYNGRVTLQASPLLNNFSVGQLVRVEGEVVEQAASGTDAVYRVSNIQAVQGH